MLRYFRCACVRSWHCNMNECTELAHLFWTLIRYGETSPATAAKTVPGADRHGNVIAFLLLDCIKSRMLHVSMSRLAPVGSHFPIVYFRVARGRRRASATSTGFGSGLPPLRVRPNPDFSSFNVTYGQLNCHPPYCPRSQALGFFVQHYAPRNLVYPFAY